MRFPTACFVLLLPLSLIQAKDQRCKARPNSADWPSTSTWARLNATVSGALLRPNPLASVCHRDFPNYNEQQCNYTKSRWTSSQFHSDHPSSCLFQNTNAYSCIPAEGTNCDPAGFPIYVINATTVQHVQAGINFAREHNVRLNIKSTGHDFLGKSVQPNSLSIWTHYLRTQEWFENQYTLKGCGYSIEGPIVKAGSGSQWRELYAAASARDLIIVGGQSTTVSLGGYMSGGGHSSISPFLGMGVDNVVEMDVVTPNGQFITVNECSYPDLFWAMRGGGGSTFGVITSFSIQTFPEVPYVTWGGSLRGNTSLEANWEAVALLHQEWSRVLSPLSVSGGITGNPNLGYATISITMPNVTSSAALHTLLDPMLARIRSQTGGAVSITGGSTFWNTSRIKPPQPAIARDDSTGYYGNGGSKLISTWLWDAKALSSPNLKTVLRNAVDNETSLWNLWVAGPGTHRGPLRGGSNAVHPAWRSAHLRTTVAMQGPVWSLDKLRERKARLKIGTKIIRNHSPGSGSYMNEADADLENHIPALYGTNYARLLSIKQKYDPWGVFYCRNCVGSVYWEEHDDGDLCLQDWSVEND